MTKPQDLFNAITKTKTVESIKALITPENINSVIKFDKKIYTHPLTLALESNNSFEVIKMLVEQGAKVQIEGANIQLQPIHAACINIKSTSSSLFQVVQFLLENGANPNSTCLDNNTPLIMTAVNDSNDSFETMKLLIENGADVMIANQIGAIASHAAMMVDPKNAIKKLELLLENGASINDTDATQRTLLHYAVLGSKENENKLELVKYLVKNNVNIKALTSNKNLSALHYALHLKCDDATEVVKFLLDQKDIDINALSNNTGLLNFACLNNSNKQLLDIIDLLIEKKLNINTINKYGENLLHYACTFPTFNTKPLIEKLIELGQNISKLDINGNTPLYSLFIKNKQYQNNKYVLEGIKTLIEKGIDVNIKNMHKFIEEGEEITIYRDALYFSCTVDNINKIENIKEILKVAYNIPFHSLKALLDVYHKSSGAEKLEYKNMVKSALNKIDQNDFDTYYENNLNEEDFNIIEELTIYRAKAPSTRKRAFEPTEKEKQNEPEAKKQKTSENQIDIHLNGSDQNNEVEPLGDSVEHSEL